MNVKKKDPIRAGTRIGRLVVFAATEARKCGYTVWRCTCDCGGEILLDTRCLQRGTVTDCGCVSNVRPGQKDLTGRRFGRLVCIEPTDRRGPNGATVWKCRCDCGKECLAASTQLSRGYKKSCGCLGRRPAEDHTGRRFGHLIVTDYAGLEGGMHRWLCRCDCGREISVAQTLLRSGQVQSCGCVGDVLPEDITGRVFGQLTALGPAERKNGADYWRCRCTCGRETVVRYAYLITGHTKSCGCLQKEVFRQNLQLVDGTSVAILKSGKKRTIASNTSGYTGVYLNRRTGKWAAQITFKGKTYYLGSFADKQDAIRARMRGEEMHDDFLERYSEAKKRRDAVQ